MQFWSSPGSSYGVIFWWCKGGGGRVALFACIISLAAADLTSPAERGLGPCQQQAYQVWVQGK